MTDPAPVVDPEGCSRGEGGGDQDDTLAEAGAPEIVIVESLSKTSAAPCIRHDVVSLVAVSDQLFPPGRAAVVEEVAARLRTMPVGADGAGFAVTCLLGARDIFVMEVEDPARWIIRALGKGAKKLMRSALHADASGRSLSEFVRCKDVSRFRSMWPSDAAGVGAQLPPKHRIWIRCHPRESGLGKRGRSSIAGGNGGLVVNGSDELSEDMPSYEQSLYAPVLVYVMQLTGNGRVLLLGSVGAPQNLGLCGKCGRAWCESTYEFQDALVAVRMQHTLRRLPERFQAISGVDLEFQEMWSDSAKRDFAWCGVFDRLWSFGYSQEQLKRMFSSMTPRLREATTALTAGVQRLIEMKRHLQESHGDVPIRDLVALRISEASEADVPDPQDGALLSLCYDDVGRRRGFQVSGWLAELLGFSSYDELVSRMMTCRMLMPIAELEMLGNILYELEKILSGTNEKSWTVYSRLVRENDTKGVLVRLDYNMVEVGMVKFTPVSVAEFDRELDKNPSIVRPFMHAIGDRRRGQELLDSARDDFKRYAVSNLRETAEGRQLLANLADVMDGRVGFAVRWLLRSAPAAQEKPTGQVAAESFVDPSGQ